MLTVVLALLLKGRPCLLGDVSVRAHSIHHALVCCFTVGGDDYTMLSSDLTLSAATTSRCVTFVTTQDTVLEQDETFTVRLSTGVGAITLDPGEATVTITNDGEEHLFRIIL